MLGSIKSEGNCSVVQNIVNNENMKFLTDCPPYDIASGIMPSGPGLLPSLDRFIASSSSFSVIGSSSE